MAAALPLGAAGRRLGGAMVQRAQAAAAEVRRRLGRRLIHNKKGAGEDITSHVQGKKEVQKSRLERWREGRLAFRRFDEEFTKLLNGAAGMILIYYVIKAGNENKAAQKEKK